MTTSHPPLTLKCSARIFPLPLLMMFPEEFANLRLRGPFHSADMFSWVYTMGFVFEIHISFLRSWRIWQHWSPHCRVTTVSGSWAVGHLPMGHAFATVVSTSTFLYQPPSFIYIICLSPSGIAVCTSYSADCPSHPSLPIQILFIIHGSSQMSPPFLSNNQVYVCSPSFEYSQHFLHFFCSIQKKKSRKTLFLKLNN